MQNEDIKPWQWLIGTLMLGAVLTTSITAIAATSSLSSIFSEEDDDGDEDNHGERLSFGTGLQTQQAAAASNSVYQEECGVCHMAYPAKLLPMQSWQRIMTTLDNHFGENAELDANTQQQILAYLQQESDRPGHIGRMLSNLPKEPPLRITELPFHKRKHREIPKKMVQNNPDVRSLSNCNACHDKAEQGIFDEDTVNIPGFGRWDD